MSPWKELIEYKNLSKLGFHETLTGGQCFGWNPTSDSSWIGSFKTKVVELRFKNRTIFWRTSLTYPAKREEILEYLWIEKSYDDAINELPWRSDSVLAECIEALPGLRILKQSIDETLFYFLLSSAKSIPQIQAIGKLVFQKYGKKLFENIYSFPGWDRLAQIPESELRTLKLGYRAKYVAQTARFIASRQNWLESIMELKYADAKKQLLRLPGVGEKVADCTLLFGGNFLEAFPIDTWIEKSMEKRYKLNGWNTAQKLHFASMHFGKFAGLAQQFLFSAERLKVFKD